MQQISKEINNIVDCLAKMAFEPGQFLKMLEEILREVVAITPIVKSRINLA